MVDFLNIARGATKAVAAGAGNDSAVADIDQQQAQAKAQKQQVLQAKIAPLSLALAGFKSRLTNASDPNDPTKAVAGKEQDYAAAHDGMAATIGKIRAIINPPPSEDKHGLSYLAHEATDKAHITNHAVADWRDAQKKRLVDYNAQNDNLTSAQVASIQPGQTADRFADMARNGATPDQVQAAREAAFTPIAPKSNENFKTIDVIKPDGTRMTVQQDTKSGKMFGLDGKALGGDDLKGAVTAPKDNAETHKRADFDKAVKDGYTGSFEKWNAEQTASGRGQIKGLQFDSKTGQVIDSSTGDRYNPGQDNPAEVQQMFKNQAEWQKKQQAFQVRLAGARGAANNATRPLPVFDSANGNAPTYATFGEMQKSPGRYIPSSAGGKAIASENLMQDIAGTSQKTRSTITALQKDGGFSESQKIKIAAAMRADDPHASLDQLIASAALGSLTPKQEDFLIATRQLSENAMAMRSVLGAGQGSDDVRRAIHDTLPNLLSPNPEFAIKQLDAFDATINRLHRGVPSVKLNETPMAGFDGPKTAGLKNGRQASAPPKGATHIVKGPDGKNHYTNAQGTVDLGIAP